MKLLNSLRNRRSHDPDLHNGAPADPADEARVPLAGYDGLDERQVGARLPDLSQVELEAVEAYERAHANRPQVLDKLRYMRESEPIEGYDALTPDQITETLAGADAQVVKQVRDYERKFANRPHVMEETARVLPTATASAGEDRADEEREARIRQGIAGREKTADDIPG